MPSHTHEECTIVKNTACIERLRRRKGGGDVERKLKLPMCTRVRVEGNALLVVVVMSAAPTHAGPHLARVMIAELHGKNLAVVAETLTTIDRPNRP